VGQHSESDTSEVRAEDEMMLCWNYILFWYLPSLFPVMRHKQEPHFISDGVDHLMPSGSANHHDNWYRSLNSRPWNVIEYLDRKLLFTTYPWINSHQTWRLISEFNDIYLGGDTISEIALFVDGVCIVRENVNHADRTQAWFLGPEETYGPTTIMNDN
jgi:hypothetical protein